MIKFYNKVFKLYYELQGVGHRQLKLDKFTFDLSLFFLLYTHFLQVTLIKSGLIQLAWEQAPGSYKLDRLTFDLSLTCTKGINSAKVRLKPKVSLPNFYGQGP